MRIHTIEVYTLVPGSSPPLGDAGTRQIGLCQVEIRHDQHTAGAADELIESLADHLAARSRTTANVYHVRRTSRDEPDNPSEAAA